MAAVQVRSHLSSQRPGEHSFRSSQPITKDTASQAGAAGRPTKRQKVNSEDGSDGTLSRTAPSVFKHSAASTKRHTRPPISVLLSSLAIPPEVFLELQAAAKTYMLDDSHPERQDTIGVRGKSDSEVVKLRLWNCAGDFLEQDGHGERFFSAHVQAEENGSQPFRWPLDKNKIIEALLPLLRRVVTNERQRQYALETRSKARLGDDKTGSSSNSTERTPERKVENTPPFVEHHTPVDYKTGTLFYEFTQKDLSTYTSWRVFENDPGVQSIRTAAGLPRSGFDELFAIIEHHLRFFHSNPEAQTIKCTQPCENSVVSGIVDSYVEVWEAGSWRCEDPDVNLCDKSINARLVLHELFQHLKVLLGHQCTPGTGSTVENQETTASAYVVDSINDKSSVSGKHSSNHRSGGVNTNITLKISILAPPTEGNDNEERVLEKRELSAADVPYRHTLLQKLLQCPQSGQVKGSTVYVHLPAGLTLIEDDSAWSFALAVVRRTSWMEGVVAVLVRVPFAR